MTITAKILADSVSVITGTRITTFELEYPRFIHAEFLTHRMFSRNSASSRAIPVDKMLELIETNPAMPVFWGKNQSGMQAVEEMDYISKAEAVKVWKETAKIVAEAARKLAKLGSHKQISNRVIEFAQNIKTICTATEFDNFFALRDHSDAQPEIHDLAKKMRLARDNSIPEKLDAGEWHLPYILTGRSEDGKQVYLDSNYHFLDKETAIKVSASCCAQVSYRKLDDSLEKALTIYDRLISSEPKHSSPFEHQATPMDGGMEDLMGLTHTDRDCNQWSNNFRDWMQYRAILETIESLK